MGKNTPTRYFYGTIWCRGKSMVSIKDRKILRQMFSHYDYVMTTAQLSKEKLYYRDIQRMLKAGLIEKVKRGYHGESRLQAIG